VLDQLLALIENGSYRFQTAITGIKHKVSNWLAVALKNNQQLTSAKRTKLT
jgi:hypothetical protein